MGQKPIFENKNRDRINSKIKSYITVSSFIKYQKRKMENRVMKKLEPENTGKLEVGK